MERPFGWASPWQSAMLFWRRAFFLLATRRVHVKSLERWVGKMSFAQQFRACCRSSFEWVYVWLEAYRASRKLAGRLWPAVRGELLASMVDLPCMYVDMALPWNERVESSDASPGGHGRAWTQFPKQMVAQVARMVEGKGCCTNLEMELGLECPQGVCPMSQVLIDEKQFSW